MTLSIVRLRVLAQGLCLLVFTAGLLVLAGWVFDMPALKSLFARSVTMKANVALGLMLGSLCLALLTRQALPVPARRTLALCGLLVALLGGLSLSQDLAGWDLGLDQGLFRDPTPAVRGVPGRMSPLAALCFLLTGLALAVLASPLPRRFRFPLLNGLAAGVCLVGTASVAGNLVNSLLAPPAWNFAPMSADTALAFIALGGALLALVRSEGGLHWALDRWTTIGFGVGMALLLVMAISTFQVTRQLHQQADLVNHSQQVLEGLEQQARDVGLAGDMKRRHDEQRRREYALLAQHKQRFNALSLRTFLMLPLAAFGSVTLLLLGMFFVNKGAIERNRVTAQLASSRSQFKTIFDNLSEGVVVIDLQRNEVVANPVALSRFGLVDPALPYEEAVALLDSVLLDGTVLSREQYPSYRAMRGDFVQDWPITVRRKSDGKAVIAEFTSVPIRNEAGDVVQLMVTYRDVTLRLAAEKQAARLTNFYAALSQTNQAVVRVRQIDTLYQDLCSICVDHCHLKMAYIGLVQGDQVVPAFFAGPAEQFLAGVALPLANGAEQPAGPVATAVQTGLPYISNNFLDDHRTLPWRQRAAYLGTRATAAFPFRRGGVVVGALSLHVAEQDFFTPELIRLVEEMMGDLSFALDNLDREAARAAADVALRASEQRIRNLFDQAADGIFVISADQHYEDANAAGLAMLGYRREELLALKVLDVLAADEHPRILASTARLMSGVPHLEEWQHQRKDGSTFPAEVSARRLSGRHFLAIVRDLTSRREAEKQSRLAVERFEKIFAGTPEGMSVTEIDTGRFVLVNDAYCKSLGYTQEEMMGNTAIELGMWVDLAQRETLVNALRSGKPVRGQELSFRARGGQVREMLSSADTIDLDGQTYMLLMFSDITERKRAEARVDYLANHDELTGLPNRSLMRDRVTQAISHAKRGDRQLAVMYLDLDRFKVINDGYGHAFGDQVLQAAAQKMLAVVRECDTLARETGDEFVVLLTELRKFSDAYIVAQKVLDAFTEPLVLQGREVHVNVSIGVSVYPQNGDSADDLVGHADVAMHRAKDLGRGTYQFFSQGMSEAANQQFALETRLRSAIAQHELSLVYQPKVDLRSGRIVGCEALLRWNHPELGNVSPARFIPIAEESGLIVPIGDWVLQTACRQNQAWIASGLPPIMMSVNVSARQFLQQDVAQWVFRTLEQTGLPPELLDLELTESLMARDAETAIATVAQLKAAHIKVSIDDFGTGYSSLSYLKRFRVDTLKIDQSFVRNMLNGPEDAAIPLAVISMAHSLGLSVIAEGVETLAQCDFLRAHGCDEMQGYWFSRPVSAEAFGQMLAEGKHIVGPPA